MIGWLVEQELLILPEYLNSPTVFRGVRVIRSLVFCIVFCRSLFVHLPFCFEYCAVCPSSIMITPLVYSNSSYMVFTSGYHLWELRTR
jgi:hypothetical protein